MNDLEKTREQLLAEISELRKKIAKLEMKKPLPQKEHKRPTKSNPAYKTAEQLLIEQNQAIIDYLKDSRLLAPFPRQFIETLVPLSQLTEIPKGDLIIQEGEENPNLYFLLRGEVSLYSEGEYILSLRRKGDIFGEESIIRRVASSTTVKADTPIRVFSIRSQDIGSCANVSMDVFHNILYRLFAVIMTDKLALTTAKAKKYEITQRQLQREIKEHQQAAEHLKVSEERFRTVISNTQAIIFTLDENGRFILSEGNGLKLLDLKPGEVVGQSAFDLYKDYPEVIAALDLAMKGEMTRSVLAANGVIFDTVFTPIKVNFGESIHVTGIATDVTERVKAEDRIKASLREKEALILEIHHRVKNNMQVISSLLGLQARGTEDETIKAILQESQNRVYAMSAVHETLYGADNLAEINMKLYLSKLAGTLLKTYGEEAAHITLTVNSSDITLNLEKASPLGLVLNELISNALKYAFPDQRKGVIEVQLKKLQTEVELSVTDDGIGLPDELDWKSAGTLGLKLVCTLVEEQLDGSIEMHSQNGTRFAVRFNPDLS